MRDVGLDFPATFRLVWKHGKIWPVAAGGVAATMTSPLLDHLIRAHQD